jgi:hypothetical protein
MALKIRRRIASAKIEKQVGGISAAVRRLATPVQRLELLVEFANLAKSTQPLSPEGVEHWNAELYAFSMVGGHQPHPPHRKTPGASLGLKAKELDDLSAKLRAGFDALLAGAMWLLSIENLTANLTSPRHGPPRAFYAGELSAVLTMAARDLLAHEAGRIARCAAPDCSRLFVRQKRGAYCSKRCSQRARTLRHRASFSEEEWRKRRHAYYKAKIDREKGPAVAAKIRQNQPIRPKPEEKEVKR